MCSGYAGGGSVNQDLGSQDVLLCSSVFTSAISPTSEQNLLSAAMRHTVTTSGQSLRPEVHLRLIVQRLGPRLVCLFWAVVSDLRH